MRAHTVKKLAGEERAPVMSCVLRVAVLAPYPAPEVVERSLLRRRRRRSPGVHPASCISALMRVSGRAR